MGIYHFHADCRYHILLEIFFVTDDDSSGQVAKVVCDQKDSGFHRWNRFTKQLAEKKMVR